jgi:molybdate transport system ATP-binding protein
MAGESLTVQLRLARPRTSFQLDVAFEAPPGITVLFGPSGSGKSTVLAAIAGLVRPDDGRIALGSEVWCDTRTKTHRPIEARRVAFVFQSLALFPHMTAAENAEYGVSLALPAAERRRRALHSLERFHVTHLASRKPATFSGGEAQRVALARAFAMSPAVVLLDEPFSALDFTLRHEFVQELRDVAKELAVPIVHVTHHRNEARALADRALLLDHGRIVARGPIDQVLPELGRRRREGGVEREETPGERDDEAPEDHSFGETPMPASS